MDQLLTGIMSYDASNVLVIVGGYKPIGWAPDSKITVSMESDIVTSAAGTDGDVATALMRDERGTMTLSMFEASPSNQVFANWIEQSRVSRITNFPVIMYDPLGSTLESIAWFQNQGDSEKTTDNPTITWTLGLKSARLKFNNFGGMGVTDIAEAILPTLGVLVR